MTVGARPLCLLVLMASLSIAGPARGAQGPPAPPSLVQTALALDLAVDEAEQLVVGRGGPAHGGS